MLSAVNVNPLQHVHVRVFSSISAPQVKWPMPGSKCLIAHQQTSIDVVWTSTVNSEWLYFIVVYLSAHSLVPLYDTVGWEVSVILEFHTRAGRFNVKFESTRRLLVDTSECINS